MSFRISPTAIQKHNFKKVHGCSNYMLEEGWNLKEWKKIYHLNITLKKKARVATLILD